MLSFFSIPYAVQKATLHLKQWLFSGIHCCFIIILCGEVVEGHAMSSFLEACLYSTSGVYALHVVGKYILNHLQLHIIGITQITIERILL